MQARQIVFRTDATSQIGTGHFMRCLTLATELKRQGAQIRFISRNLPEHLRNLLTAQGITSNALESPANPAAIDELKHAHWLGTSQAQDAQATIQALSDSALDWLIVDHYALDARWESTMRKAAKHIMVIDDIADRQHDCDVLLDQNYYSDMQTRYQGKVPAHCTMLLGPRYALLREEFHKQRAQVQTRTGPVKRILVFFGGIDANNYTGIAITTLSELAIKDVLVDVVVGAQHPKRGDIETECAAHGFNCYVQTSRMAELMAAADLAIGAGGTVAWERCCLGLPALSVCIADNQRKQLEDAAEVGLLYSPSFSGDLLCMLKKHIEAILENAPLLRLISSISMKAVDGRGKRRVADILDISEVEIRKATDLDARNIFEWRNHESIRLVSKNAELVGWEEHQSWFASVLANKDKALLIGHIGNLPVGVVRFDKQEDVAEVSIYLVPESGFSGFGGHLLKSAEQWLRNNWPSTKYIRAAVLSSNLPSKKMFHRANYSTDTIFYRKNLWD